MQGERSLRGMGMRACKRQKILLASPDLAYVPHFEKTKTDFAVSSGVEDTYGRDYCFVMLDFVLLQPDTDA